MSVRQLLARIRLLTSSKAQKRAVLALVLTSLLAILAAQRAPVLSQRRPSLSFYQLDVEFDGDRHQKSAWGAVDFRFVGSEGFLYFNLTVLSGNSGSPVWRIQNVPVLSREGPNVRQTTTFHFNLANPPGDRVASLEYGYALTAQPLSEMPELAVRQHVRRRDYAIDTGYGGEPITFVPPPDFLAGGAAAGEPCSHEGFPNQEAAKDECVPAATSNSLNWMNELYGLGIATEDITLEAMKVADGLGTEHPGLRRQLAEARRRSIWWIAGSPLRPRLSTDSGSTRSSRRSAPDVTSKSESGTIRRPSRESRDSPTATTRSSSPMTATRTGQGA